MRNVGWFISGPKGEMISKGKLWSETERLLRRLRSAGCLIRRLAAHDLRQKKP
jgi:hypothetical protein